VCWEKDSTVNKAPETKKIKSKGKNKPSILPKTLFTAPTQPSHDIPTLRTTVCNQAKLKIITQSKISNNHNVNKSRRGKAAKTKTCSKTGEDFS